MERLFSLTRALVARKRKIFALFFALAASIGLSWATTVTWDSNTLSSIYISDGESFTKDGVTLTVLDGMIDGQRGSWMGNSENASFKFSTSLGNFTRIEITGVIRGLGGSGWTQTSPGAVWTGDANETTFGMYFKNVTQIVFTIEEPAAPAITKTITDNGMTYDIYDNGVVKVSGTGIAAARIFAANDHDYVTSVKRFEFADDCKVYSFGEDWYMCYMSNSPLEAADIKTTHPFVAGRSFVFYRKESGSDESVTVTITAPAIASINRDFVANYGTPQHIIFNMPVTTFEKNWCSYLREKDTVTIPTGSLYHLPASYVFKDGYLQDRYDDMAADGMEDDFWHYEASDLVEGVDYTRTEEETGVITAENDSVVFGKAVVKYQAPQEAPATSWTFWRSDDFKTFPELEKGSSHTCKDVTLKIVDGSFDKSGSNISLFTSATNGIQLIAPKGKIFKQVIALDRNLSTPFIWTGEADTVGISSNLIWISLIEFELDAASASVTLPEAVTELVYTGEAQTLVTAGEAEGYTFQYKVGENGEYSTDLPTATDAGSYTVYYKATNGNEEQDITGSLEVSIAKAALTITAENKEVVYGYAAPGFSVSYSGLQGSDLPADVLTGELSYACDYTAGSNAGEYDITPGGQSSANYDITYVKGTLVVYKADPAFTAPTANTLTYNGGVQTLIAAGTTEHGTFEYTFTPNDEESWSTALPQAKNADTYGVYYRVVGDANHLDYESADAVVVTIAKAALTATADDKSVIYGDDAPEYTVTYEGWQGEDNADVLSGTIAYACEYAPTSIVGEYTITPSGVSNPDYAITFINGKVTVNKAALTITADNKELTYGDEAPEYTAVFEGWKNEEDESDLDELDYICTYEQGSPVGTYTIAPIATDHNYDITITDATLTVNQAAVIVSGAKVQIAKFEDGTTDAVVLDKGILNGVKLNDPVDHITTATFSDATVGEHKTIRVNYELTGDAALLANYDLILTAEDYIEEGIIIEKFIPDNNPDEKEDDEAQIEEGIEVYAYGYCDGSGYSLRYHLNSGNPDQYKIDFDDSRFEDVNWTNLTTPGKDGTIDIEIPVDMPTGDYTFTATFRDSRFDWLESNALNVTFHVNLPETYVTPMFDNTIALVDTCNCFTDIQWYHRADASDAWQPIAGATGYYYRPADGSKLTGEFFVQAKMNGVPTYTCGQADMQTLYGADKQQKAIVKAFPNPVVNTTTVSIEHSDNWEHALRVVNLMGVEIINTTFEGDRTTIDLDGHAQGNYMISVDGIVVKVMKQ